MFRDDSYMTLIEGYVPFLIIKDNRSANENENEIRTKLNLDYLSQTMEKAVNSFMTFIFTTIATRARMYHNGGEQ